MSDRRFPLRFQSGSPSKMPRPRRAPIRNWRNRPMPNEPATLLVVDDNPATLYSTAHVLRRAGYTVLEAETGSRAVEPAEGMVDCVILAVNLPDFSGFEISRRIRGLEKPTGVPVIHLSATFVNDVDKVHG